MHLDAGVDRRRERRRRRARAGRRTSRPDTARSRRPRRSTVRAADRGAGRASRRSRSSPSASRRRRTAPAPSPSPNPAMPPVPFGSAADAMLVARRREEQADDDQHRDRRELRDHQRDLHVAAGANAEAVHQRENRRASIAATTCSGIAEPVSSREVAAEDDRRAGHAAGLHDEQQRPSIEERDDRMIRVAKIRILSADVRPQRAPARRRRTRRSARWRRRSPTRRVTRRRRVDLPRDDARIDEDARADDPAHHDHRRVERAEAAGERRLGAGLIRSRRGGDGVGEWLRHGARRYGPRQTGSTRAADVPADGPSATFQPSPGGLYRTLSEHLASNAATRDQTSRCPTDQPTG